MRPDQWEMLQKCASGADLDSLPVALIVDSPWIPGYLQMSTLDYLTLPDVWLQANLRVLQDFPEIIFIPGFWIEYGMAAEPSGFGCRVSTLGDKTPLVQTLGADFQMVEQLKVPDPRCDGLMPVLLYWYRHAQPRIEDAGYMVKIVAARGPLATATHLFGVTDFLLNLKLQPELTHRLLEKTTRLAIDWLQAQAEVLHSPGGILLLDDIVGFLSPKDYLEFGHPYLEKIFSAFPDAMKIFHNDMSNPVSYPHLESLGVNIFNFTHLIDLGRARELAGQKIVLMGNIPPLDVLARGTQQQVLDSVVACRRAHPGRKGWILSAGGGVSPGTPWENVRALITAAKSKEQA